MLTATIAVYIYISFYMIINSVFKRRRQINGHTESAFNYGIPSYMISEIPRNYKVLLVWKYIQEEVNNSVCLPGNIFSGVRTA